MILSNFCQKYIRNIIILQLLLKAKIMAKQNLNIDVTVNWIKFDSFQSYFKIVIVKMSNNNLIS